MPISPYTRAVQDQQNNRTLIPQKDISIPSHKGWATPESIKADLVDQMISIIQDPEVKTKDRVAAFNALRVADQSQWERDNPVESGKSKGGSTSSVNINLNMAAAAALRGMIERGELGIIEELPVLDQPGTPSDGR